MVAITVILAAAIVPIVLNQTGKMGESAPNIGVTVEDHQDAYTQSQEDMFRIQIESMSERVTVSQVQLNLIESDGSTHTFLGQDATGGVDIPAAGGDTDIEVTINGQSKSGGSNWDASTELSSGDVLIITDVGGSGDLPDYTDYTIELVYVGGEEPKVVSSNEVRLR